MEWCEEQGMIWMGVEEVEGVSGSSPGDRADLQRLRNRKATQNDFEIVAIQDRSRWTRAGTDHGAWLRVEFGRIGIRIVNVNFPVAENDRYTWMIEGMQDEASLSYVRQSSHDGCRGVMEAIEDDVLATCRTPPFGIDRLYLNADDKPMFIIRNLRDGRQQRLDHITKEVLETYPATVKNQPTRHFRKSKLDKVRLIPGYDEAITAIRYVLHQYYTAGWGYRRIGIGLNDQGILSPNGTIWGIASVEQIVHSPIYCGVGIGNMWASGKFHVRNAVAPKPVPYNMYELMDRKYKKRTMRPHGEWLIKNYTALNEIIPDDNLRTTIWEKQYDYLKRRAAGLLTPTTKDRHVDSNFFLKHILSCKETGLPFIGKISSKNTRYYFLSRGQHLPDKKKPYLSRVVAADPIEKAIKDVLREVLRSNDELDDIIRVAVETEATKADHSMTEMAAIEEERKHVGSQISFALRNLVDMGDEAMNEIVAPLKEKRHMLDRRHMALRDSAQHGVVDVGKTVATIKSKLMAAGDSLDSIPPLQVRRLVQSFANITINLEDFMVDLDIRLPLWAIRNSSRIAEIVGTESLLCHTERLKTHRAEGVKIAEYRCLFHRGYHFAPCFDCQRVRSNAPAHSNNHTQSIVRKAA